MQQAADHAAGDADGQAPPGAVVDRAPGAEPHTEDQHALETDVDDTGSLGEKTTEPGAGDRYGEAQHLASGGERGSARSRASVLAPCLQMHGNLV